MQLEATMHSSPSIVIALICGSLLLDACASKRVPAKSTAGRFNVEVLKHGIDPQIIPDRFVADFDGDGAIDWFIVTDSAVQIDLTGGGEFRYSVREPGDESPRIWDAKVFSFRQDGKFPSIVLATCPEPSHARYSVTQQVVYNDNGRLVHKRLGAYPATVSVWSPGAYPMRALGLDCAWLESNDLPVCFFASMEDGALGVSRLIELDPNGYKQLASDSALRSNRQLRMARQWERFRHFATDSAQVASTSSAARDVVWGWLGLDSATLDRILPDYLPSREATVSDTLVAALDWLLQSSAREQAWAYLHMDSEVFGSILSESDVKEPDSAVDIVLAVALSRLDHEAVFSHDVTRAYRLPWPAQRGHTGANVDGVAMIDAVFLDFSGDGLLDLVVVGQHSRPFSAIQGSGGYFTKAEYHAVPDEYVRVWAPKVGEGTEVTVPPCVYFGMEKTEEEAWRSDYVYCYDQGLDDWYEVSLPGGPYWTEYEPVMFWDMNTDGMIDFAARKEDGGWTALTFVEESR
jgi:hypothetical protein